ADGSADGNAGWVAFRWAGRIQFHRASANRSSASLERRRALLEEGLYALAEVLAASPGDRELDLVDAGEAGVAQDQVQVRLGLTERERRLLGDLAGERAGLALDL